ncbi:hypothetical protein K7X08_035075 [Anisodus acutangulus]|uniref:Uncharacterized protein n=1 Tax=Anisodus acutangulus TaxID=402998 RepID=A0A9Q1LKG1_9SOLA|nr:hypothetical protein K7X08_035075 [Anisodus acutangulus]
MDNAARGRPLHGYSLSEMAQSNLVLIVIAYLACSIVDIRQLMILMCNQQRIIEYVIIAKIKQALICPLGLVPASFMYR